MPTARRTSRVSILKPFFHLSKMASVTTNLTPQVQSFAGHEANTAVDRVFTFLTLPSFLLLQFSFALEAPRNESLNLFQV